MGVDEPGGYLSDPAGNLARVRAVVEAAIANDMYVIIDWHSHHAEQHTQAAIDFFTTMARDYGAYPNVIYEIYNEPLQVSWSGTIKPYAERVIAAIRAIDPDNLIVVGTPTWSQDVDQAADDPIRGHANIAYTLHFYAGTHGQYLRDKAQYALDRGIPLFVTEWGSVNANGDGGVNHGETEAWMTFLRANRISHANWALNDKAEGASALRPGASPTGPWADGDHTASGTLARDIVRNWPALDGGATPAPSCPRVALPGRIEAEAYCAMQGVRTQPTSDAGGGLNVGWMDAGDWLSYDVHLPAAGRYTVRYRVAAAAQSGTLRLEQAGGALAYGEAHVPVTGGWQNWTTIEHDVELPGGDQSLGLAVVNGGWNLNWFEVTAAASAPGPECNRHRLPGKIEAEAACVLDGVQTETTTDSGGGLNVGWIDAGDRLLFDIDVESGGVHRFEFRVASLANGGRFTVERNGVELGTVHFPATGGWQNWTTVATDFDLPAGPATLVLRSVNDGWNINWLSAAPSGGGSGGGPAPACDGAPSLQHGASVTVRQGDCLRYQHGWGAVRLGTWNAPGEVRYAVTNCAGQTQSGIVQTPNAFTAVDTGTQNCEHRIVVEQAAGPYSLQLGSW
ncbi:MAG: hypothetical protein KatS3mg121_1107 [Gammaproteobacteria bacterium]|nr:MAG: hypothetical protein KatS3mg121_1107 [Gammaproteobacteria bacterium]